ncbi:MAG: PAS domain-containing protein [Chloroflexi bacterium]|nr:PAS domain-containing protein [Chloroflexota bacterium]
MLKNKSPDPLAPRWMDRALYSLTDGLVLMDETAHVAFWNPRAEEVLGWPAVEMVGRRVDELLDRIVARVTAPEPVRAKLQDALALPESDTTIEIELIPLPPALNAELNAATPARAGRHDRTRYVSARLFPVRDADEKHIGVGILLHDVTREREADAMKSQLLSTVSHELRTPLASVKGFATTLLRQDVKWDETTQRDFLRIIEEEADRLTEIIDNLLDMSQLEAGALRVEKEPIQLRTLIREVVDEMRMSTEAHWFVVDLPAELPLVLADARRIRQVLHNLVENAIKYSKGGQITVACQLEKEQVIVGVADQGEGIPAQFLDQVFERFFQIDGASTRRVGGSGLGLSISRGIVEAHGGRIWAESKAGQGSVFRFTLPLVAPDTGE